MIRPFWIWGPHHLFFLCEKSLFLAFYSVLSLSFSCLFFLNKPTLLKRPPVQCQPPHPTTFSIVFSIACTSHLCDRNPCCLEKVYRGPLHIQCMGPLYYRFYMFRSIWLNPVLLPFSWWNCPLQAVSHLSYQQPVHLHVTQDKMPTTVQLSLSLEPRSHNSTFTLNT